MTPFVTKLAVLCSAMVLAEAASSIRSVEGVWLLDARSNANPFAFHLTDVSPEPAQLCLRERHRFWLSAPAASAVLNPMTPTDGLDRIEGDWSQVGDKLAFHPETVNGMPLDAYMRWQDQELERAAVRNAAKRDGDGAPLSESDLELAKTRYRRWMDFRWGSLVAAVPEKGSVDPNGNLVIVCDHGTRLLFRRP